MTVRQAAFRRAPKDQWIIEPLTSYFPRQKCIQKDLCVCVFVLSVLPGCFYLCFCAYPVCRHAATSVSNVMCGSIIRTVCGTDTQHETWLLQLHFAGSLQYETCHLYVPPRPGTLWLRHFWGAPLSELHACEGFCAFSCATAHRLLFMMRFKQLGLPTTAF